MEATTDLPATRLFGKGDMRTEKTKYIVFAGFVLLLDGETNMQRNFH